MKYLLLPLMVSGLFTVSAQTIKKCYSREAIDFQNQATPGYADHVDQQFQIAKQWQQENGATRSVYTIPVVVHVVYNIEAGNIPDSVIFNQLERLNEDYSRTNADTVNMRSEFEPVAGATQVRFVLASVDPMGNPTNGITRTQTATASFGNIDILVSGDFSETEKVKSTADGGIDPWNQSRYLNIWVCDLSIFGSTILLGYATPPANLPNWPAGSTPVLGDGVVLQYQTIGSNNSATIPGYTVVGRTATHEIGHYLGLRHIWGDANCGEDGIDDTPHASEASQQDCDATKNTCVDVMPQGDLHDMIENYMDYSAETCQNSFTAGQGALMHGVLENQRYDLVHNNVALGLEAPSVNFSYYPNPARENLTIHSNNPVANIRVIDMNGRIRLSAKVSGMAATIDTHALSSGIYTVQIECENGSYAQQRFTITQ